MRYRWLFFFLLFPLTLWATPMGVTSLCGLALQPNQGELILDQINERLDTRLFDSSLSDTQKSLAESSPHRFKKLNRYLTSLKLRDLALPSKHESIANEILERVYGDRYSMIRKLSTPRAEMQKERQQRLLKEFLLRKGLREIFAEIGYSSPTALQKLKNRVHTLLKKTGVLWIVARASLSPFKYQEVPEELLEAIVLNGWEANQTAINRYFSGQSKRHLFNELHRELTFIMISAFTLTGYFAATDEALQHYTSVESETVSVFNDGKTILDEQRKVIDSQLGEQEELLETLERLRSGEPETNPEPSANSQE